MLKRPDFQLSPLSRRADAAEENVLPLINVVFLLLIFFMVSGSLIQEPPFALTPPATRHAESAHAQSEYLAIGADGRLAWLGDGISRDQLADRLAQRADPGATLQVRADRRLEARALTQLLTELRSGGVARIQLLTEHQ